MPKRISVAKHLTIEQLEQYYRQAKDGVESRQYQIIWLLAQGKKTLEVEEITGYSRTWMYALVKRYNAGGIEGLGDRRNQNPGTKPLIDDVEQAQLWQALQDKLGLNRKWLSGHDMTQEIPLADLRLIEWGGYLRLDEDMKWAANNVLARWLR